MGKTVRECLTCIGAEAPDFFNGCQTINEEFSRIKKAYFKKALLTHPDKGGQVDIFRDVQTSFEILREMYDSGDVSTFESSGDVSSHKYRNVREEFEKRDTPSWEYYYNAADEVVPSYRVELAKSNRSSCKAKGKAKKCEDTQIDKDEIRFGSLDSMAGSYTRWVHLHCWRVPSSIWLGLPDPVECKDKALFEEAFVGMNEVHLCGFSELSKSNRSKVVEYAMDKDNWARLIKRNKPSMNDSNGDVDSNTNVKEEKLARSETALAVQSKAKQERFIVPVPGKNGAIRDALKGKRVVLSGVFPELGGGAGLNVGKGKAKAMIESFGGIVTGSVSGKTDVLLVGREPGFSKVSQARSRPNVQMMDIRTLVDVAIEKGSLLTESGEGASESALAVKPRKMIIKQFSGGYRGNSSAQYADDTELAIASGEQEHHEREQTKLSKVRPKRAAKSAPAAKAAKAAKPTKATKPKVLKLKNAKAPTIALDIAESKIATKKKPTKASMSKTKRSTQLTKATKAKRSKII